MASLRPALHRTPGCPRDHFGHNLLIIVTIVNEDDENDDSDDNDDNENDDHHCH